MSGLQTQLEQSRLQEAELLGALKEMQDKVLDLEKVCVHVCLTFFQNSEFSSMIWKDASAPVVMIRSSVAMIELIWLVRTQMISEIILNCMKKYTAF